MAYQILYLKDIPELKSRRGNAITPLLAAIMGPNYPLTEAVAFYEWQDGSTLATDDFEAVGSLLGSPSVGRWIRVELSDIPQVNSDWNSSSGPSQVLNKPTLFSGDYNDLTNKPTILQRIRVQTATDGSYTWTFPTAFSGTPVVEITVEDGSSATWNHRITSLSSTAVSIQLGKLTATSLLGINLLQIASNPQAYIHIMAVAP